MTTYNKSNRRLYYDKAMELYFEKKLGIAEISRIFSVKESTIRYWISTFAKTKPNNSSYSMAGKKSNKVLSPVTNQADVNDESVNSVDVIALRKELVSLKQKLADAELKAELYNEIINVAEDKFNISIRKKAGTKQ